MEARKNGFCTKLGTDHSTTSNQRHKVTIIAVRETETLANTRRPAPAMPKTCDQLKHLKSPDKCIELCNFEIKVKKHFLG